MIYPPHSPNEKTELNTLSGLGILTPETVGYLDRIIRLAKQTLDCENAALFVVDATGKWIKSSANSELTDSAIIEAFHAFERIDDNFLSVNNVTRDARFDNIPLISCTPDIVFFSAIKLYLDHRVIGMLCAFDRSEKAIDNERENSLRDLGALVESELARDQILQTNKGLTCIRKQLEEAQKLARVRSDILEKIVTSVSLENILTDIVNAVEREYEGRKCSVLLLEGNRLVMGAAPSLPAFYNNAIDGVEIGAGVGSCGNTAFTNALTIVDDIHTHPYWSGWKSVAAQAQLASCWSQPIRGADGQVLGTFAIYHDRISSPSAEAIFQIEQFAHIASIAIERERANALIWRQANFDILTGLPNRNLMEDHLNQALKVADRERNKVAVLFLDLDNFKDVNDSLGHGAGDDLLIECSRRIKIILKEEDTVSRLGGDEFVIIVGGVTDAYSLEALVQSLLKTVSEPYSIQHQLIHSSTSIGISLYPNDGSDISSLLKNSDQAMYGAKAQGKNSYQYYTKSMQDDAMKRIRVLSDLREALSAKQFFVEYQPIIDLETNKIVKAEALIRWQHPLDGRISPDDFIPLAEESGLILDISNWVFEQVCQDALLWRKKYTENLQLTINTSPCQYNSSESDITFWLNYLLDIGLTPDAVLLEITENLFMGANVHVANKLYQFRQAGVGIALDDFGTGYSSISYLKKYPTDVIKIDKSFVQSMTDVSNDKVLCEAIIVMAKKLGIKVVAEGIESQEQLTILKKMGCDYGQGYFFSKPVNRQRFEKLLKSSV